MEFQWKYLYSDSTASKELHSAPSFILDTDTFLFRDSTACVSPESPKVNNDPSFIESLNNEEETNNDDGENGYKIDSIQEKGGSSEEEDNNDENGEEKRSDHLQSSVVVHRSSFGTSTQEEII